MVYLKGCIFRRNEFFRAIHGAEADMTLFPESNNAANMAGYTFFVLN
jgi:hypothetical protein